MPEYVDYDHLEAELSGSPLVQVYERSNVLKELVVTVIILGLALNILANSIWSLPEIPTDPIVILYKGTIAGLAISTIVFLGIYLARLHFRDISRIKASFRTVAIWDSLAGNIPILNYASFYDPQNNLYLLAENEEVCTVKTEVLKDCEEDHCLKIARQLFERVLFLIISSWKGPTELAHTTKTFREFFHYDNFLVPESQKDTVALSLPGEYDVSYSVTQGEGGNFTVKWRDGFSGSFSIIFGTQVRPVLYTAEKVGRKAWHRLSGMTLTDELDSNIDSKGLVRGTFNVLIQARLSPFDLSLGRNHSREIFSWIKLLVGNLRRFMDWDYARYRATRATLGSR